MSHEPEHPDTLAAYVAGGLSPDERQRLERRAATDPRLAGELEELMALDASLTQSAGVADVLAGLEDRLAAAIETTRPLRTWAVHPMVRRAAVATAACLLLGTAGYFGSTAMDDGKLPGWVRDRTQSNLGQMGRTLGKYSNENKGNFPRTHAERSATVSSLKSTATDLTRQQKYGEALGVINQILVLDPNDDYANGAKQLVQDKAQLHEQRQYREAHDYQFSKQLNRAEEAKIPYDDILKYPSDWPDLSARRDQTNAPVRGDEVSRWIEGGVPDFKDAPSFNLSSTSNTESGGGSPKSGLFAGKDATATGWYDGGFKYTPTGQVPNTYFDGTQVTAGRSVMIKGNGKAGDQDGQNVLYADGHAEFQQTPLAGQQNDNIYARNSNVGQGTNTNCGIDSRYAPTHAADSVLGIDMKNTVGPDEPAKPTSQTETGVRARRQEPLYNFETSLQDAAAALGRGDQAAADKAIKAAEAARGSHNEWTEAERKVMDQRIADVRGGRVQVAQIEPGQAPPATQATAVVAEARKVIRTGEVVFEIDRFDSAAGTIGKIVGENGGIVVTINSDKLPNGKVRGQLIVRVPPDRLDIFVLQLRGLGELKSQRLGSSDITKEYYDLASDLRAARAMEERLLAIIKNGSGAIKDLLEAEKELANWRGKIEKIVGQQKYYDNLVSMATLTLTLFERDIAVAAATTERETINSGIESDDVEKARTQALEILSEAKARIISSDLKKLDAGQVASTIVADIPPDNAAAVVDRIKQLGKVARLEVQRAMSADPNAPTAATSKVERKDARLTLSLYNVANVQPRTNTSIELASADAAGAYNAIAAKAIKAGGRVVRGGASLQRGNTANADGVFEVPAEAGEVFLAELKTLGDVVSMSTTEAPDAANVTTSKRGFTVQITPAANLPPRQSAAMRVETSDVDAASANLQATLMAAGGRVLDASTATDPAGQSIARVQLEVPLAKAGDLVTAAKSLGVVRGISSTQNAAAPGGALAKARLEVVFATPGPIVSQESGLMANIRDGLATSARGLLFGVKMIVIGLCFVLPWVIVLWVGAKIFRRKNTATVPST